METWRVTADNTKSLKNVNNLRWWELILYFFFYLLLKLNFKFVFLSFFEHGPPQIQFYNNPYPLLKDMHKAFYHVDVAVLLLTTRGIKGVNYIGSHMSHFTVNFCVMLECVTHIGEGLYTFVIVSVSSAWVCVCELYWGHLNVLVYVCVGVCVTDVQCKLFREGSMGFGLGLVLPLLLDLNCGPDCLTPTSFCVLPSLHLSSPIHFSVCATFNLFFLSLPLLTSPLLLFFPQLYHFSVVKLCCSWGTWVIELGCKA